MSKFVSTIDRARSAWKLCEIGLRAAPVSDARKLADQIATELLALNLVGKAKQ